jgi:hypothetical protein
MEVQVEQVQKVYGGSQVTSCVDSNIALDQGKPGASHRIIDFYFELISLC